MMPLALIGLFALTGWGLFVWSMYRAGKNKSKLKDALSSNAKLIEALRSERKISHEELEKLSGKHLTLDDANALNRLP